MTYYIRMAMAFILSFATGYLLPFDLKEQRVGKGIRPYKVGAQRQPVRPRVRGRSVAGSSRPANNRAKPEPPEVHQTLSMPKTNPLMDELASWGRSDLYWRVAGALPERPLGYGTWEFGKISKDLKFPYGEALLSVSNRLDQLNRTYPIAGPEIPFDYLAFAESPSRLDGFAGRPQSGRILPSHGQLIRGLREAMGKRFVTGNEYEATFKAKADEILRAVFRRRHALGGLLTQGGNRLELERVSAVLLRFDRERGRKVVYIISHGEDSRLEQLLDELRDRRRSLRSTIKAILEQ